MKSTQALLLAPLLCFLLAACEDTRYKETEDLHDLTLAALVISGQAIELEDGKTGTYELDVDSDEESITVTATANNEDNELLYLFGNYDSSIDWEEFESGDTFTVELSDGPNLLRILVVSPDSNVQLTYTVEIYRASSVAGLSSYAYYVSGDEEDVQVTLNPAFDPQTYDYTATVPYSDCYVYTRIATGLRDNVIIHNGEEIESGDIVYHALEPGENILDTFVSAGNDQHTVRYSTVITREQPSDVQLQANARLAGLSVAGHELDFLCERTVYELTVNSDTESLFITAEPEVDGVEMVITDRDLEAGEEIEIPIEPGDSTISIRVQSLSGNSSKYYILYVNRLNTNRVYVETTEGLQFALKNANPSDEIVLAPGTYAGTPGNETSGHTTAAFYSQRSGTELNRIYLIAEDADEDTIVQGNLSEGIDALRIEGDYWQINGIEFQNARTGIVLNNAHHNRLNTISINSATQAVVLANGSSHNDIYGTEIEAIEDANTQLPLIELQANSQAVAEGNRIRRNDILNNAYVPAIQLNNHYRNTKIESNRFESYSEKESAVPQVRAYGNDTLITFNTFYPADSEILTPLIEVEKPSETEGDWGENTYVYQNWLVDAHADRPLLHSETAVNLQATENIAKTALALEDDYTNAKYSGAAVNIDQYTPPHYQIQLSEVPELCLGLEESNDIYFGVIVGCADVAEQHWQLETGNDFYVYLKNLSQEEDKYLMPVTGFTGYCESIAGANSFTYLSEKRYGYAQHWALYENDNGEYFFINKQNQEYGLTVSGSTFTEGTAVVACPFSDTERQLFNLVEL